MKKKNIPPYLHIVKLRFQDKATLYTEVEFVLGLFEKMSDAEHIRRMIASSNPFYVVTLSTMEVPNPRLSYDLQTQCDYRVF